MDSTLLDRYVRSYVADLTWKMAEIDREALGRVIDLLLDARANGRQVLLAGDLGEGTIDFGSPAFTRLRVISLADNHALITAIGNDLSYEDVFSEQLKMLMRPGDVVMFISSSGNSPYLLRAADHARTHGATTVGLLGFGGGKLAPMMDVPVVVSSRNYGITEDFHISVQHIYTQYLRRTLAESLQRVAFLDRDGIINERVAEHAYIERWDDFRFRTGAVPMLSGLATDGYRLVVVTNQADVAAARSAGFLTRILVGSVADVAATHMVADLAQVRPLLHAARD